MVLDLLAEERGIGEVQVVGDLLHGHVGIAEAVLDGLEGVALKRHRNSEITLLQASKDMHESHFPMKITALSAHMADVEVMYSDTKITNFVAKWAI